MHPIQKKLLDLARVKDISKIRRVDLVDIIGCDYPSQITHHLDQLLKRGDLVKSSTGIKPALANIASTIRIPIMGEADCGEATKYASATIQGYLSVSPSVLSTNIREGLYALVARGDSMNRASISNNELHDGDYAIVQKYDGQDLPDKKIVVSIIDGVSNIKRLVRDPKNSRIVLTSESYRQEDFSPIIIDENDEFTVDGIVVDIVKAI